MRVERVYDWHRQQGLREVDPLRVDISVRPQDAVRLGHLTDSHLGKGKPGRRLGALRHWLETLEGVGVDGIVHSGDLVESVDDEGGLERAFEVLSAAKVPLVGVPGNHDVGRPGQSSAVVEHWGPFPRRENCGGAAVFLTNSMAAPPVAKRADWEREEAAKSGFYSRGALGQTQREKLASLLAESAQGPRILVVHHHIRQPVPAKPWYEANDRLMAPLDDADELMALVGSGEVDMVMHGHRHQYVAPYAPFEGSIILGGASVTAAGAQRARVIDLAESGGAARIWELRRFNESRGR